MNPLHPWKYMRVVWALLLILPVASLHAQARVADLKERLELGLRARTPRDHALIGIVLQGVANKTIPRSLVDKAFLWTRRNQKINASKVMQFEFALRTLARRERVNIPILPANQNATMPVNEVPVQRTFLTTFYNSLSRTFRLLGLAP